MENKEYYLGLDIGTNSVGWAVSDTTTDYNIIKAKGKYLQGVRLFDEASGCEERRVNRTNRRRLNRRRQRLDCLENIFKDEIEKVDPTFFLRFENSFLQKDDKDSEINTPYILFNDENFTDIDFHKKYPTIYHLRNEFVSSNESKDIRLLFIAIHHIIKRRGHFLLDISNDSDDVNFNDSIEQFKNFLYDRYDIILDYDDEVSSAMQLRTKTEREKAIKAHIKLSENEIIDFKTLCKLLSGASVGINKLFPDSEYESKKVTLETELDQIYEELSDTMGDDIDFIQNAQLVYNASKLSSLLGNNQYICQAKVELFNKNKNDLKRLKTFVKENYTEKYKFIFEKRSGSIKNYAAYSQYKSNGEHSEIKCTQEEFCNFLKKELPKMGSDEKYSDIYSEITDKTFLKKLRSKDNGVIPNQIHRKELKKILENAASYTPFLNESDGRYTNIEKILSVFDYKIPYYVGPLNKNSDKSWVIRKDEKIYPWNINEIVDLDASAEAFMNKLTGKCEMTGENVLPKDSLLYSKFMVLNEINKIKVNESAISVDAKQKLFRTLFENSNSKVTIKSIKKQLIQMGIAEQTSEISGVNNIVQSKLKSYHDFKKILAKTDNNVDMVENIIKGILVYADDKKLLKSWLRKNFKVLDNNDIDYISRLKYKDWGKFSKNFLTEIYHIDKNGEAFSIMDMLWNTNDNLMQLLSSNYSFADNAEKYRNEHMEINNRLEDKLDDMYLSPSVKRSVVQSVKIVKEIVSVMKSAPKKIFIEVTREHQESKTTISRKNQLITLYENTGHKDTDLYNKLINMDEYKLRSQKYYLYFSQFGKCMYSGENINLDSIMDKTYVDIDHIYPKSRIKDDSLNNKVLVKSQLNREKSHIYPIREDIRNKMSAFWYTLKEKGVISKEKYSRLIRNTPLTAEELSAFVNRQLVETNQSTKAVATLFKEFYPDTKIVYSKAGNVSTFRNQYDMLKFRDVNDHHHAKDAYLNIVVGNVFDTRFTERFFLNIEKEDNYTINKIFKYNTKNAWDIGENKSITSVKRNFKNNNVLVTKLATEKGGKIIDVKLKPAGKGQLPIKKGLDIKKYGGYNNRYSAYSCLVEHTSKKKRVRTVEPVFIYAKPLFESDPQKYCDDILGLEDAKVIIPKILKDTLFKINDIRYRVTGRTDDRLTVEHDYQLLLEYDWIVYLKQLKDYVDKCKLLDVELNAPQFKQGNKNITINSENNIKLYSILLSKLENSVYGKIAPTVLKSVKNGKEKFDQLGVLEQSQLLLNLLEFFKCTSTAADLQKIGGSANSGKLKISGKMTSNESAYIIDQSITGIYEHKRNLLK